ncbi:MAG: hypothetical protein ABH879_06365 [archaeon]
MRLFHKKRKTDRITDLRDTTLARLDTLKEFTPNQFYSITALFFRKYFALGHNPTYEEAGELMKAKKVRKAIKRKVFLFTSKVSRLRYGQQHITKGRIEKLLLEFRSIVLLLTVKRITETAGRARRVHNAVKEAGAYAILQAELARDVIEKTAELLTIRIYLLLMRFGRVRPQSKEDHKGALSEIDSHLRAGNVAEAKMRYKQFLLKYKTLASHERAQVYPRLLTLHKKLTASGDGKSSMQK